MKFCYILRLKDMKFYVGITSDLQRRFRDHFNGVGSKWTNRYEPIESINVTIRKLKLI